MHTNTIVISVHTNIIVIIVNILIHINKSSMYEWEDPHLGRHLVFGGGHHIQTSHSKQLSLVVLPTLPCPLKVGLNGPAHFFSFLV